MSKKTLNKQNLTALGAEALAELLLEISRGNAAQQRRLRMELSANVGTADVARDIRKRFASLRRSTGFVSWRKKSSFARELADLVGLVQTRVAPEDPNEAFDLLWSFLQLAPSIYERCDDSSGVIGGVMSDAMEALSDLAPQLNIDGTILADRVFEALQDNGYGEFDGAIPALADAFGPDGLAHLKTLAQTAEAIPLSEADLARYDFVDDPERQREMARDAHNRSAGMILQDVADLEGDVDAYMARYSAEQLTFHTIAPDIATRLLAAGRAEDALKIVTNARDGDPRQLAPGHEHIARGTQGVPGPPQSLPPRGSHWPRQTDRIADIGRRFVSILQLEAGDCCLQCHAVPQQSTRQSTSRIPQHHIEHRECRPGRKCHSIRGFARWTGDPTRQHVYGLGIA